ncbi:MAG: molybdate transport system regulatory protein [Candidatus Magnetoglobus multicellularis str. Araruama]|uniref:Molybdate transport system regulatory protein n=1 Tax=Candidatus Magnetoglobus multicellularis str. Araruama TaxID=890399 RepID=A0A1V1P767_9BACT|nr:MAG: molybdate transport system regulatory protein [Candidatus Magnetoglobus multicellularis str. Araruama]
MVFGSGRLKIFKAIQRTGSINAAAKELKIGYRAVWARITATEQRLGQKLLIKQSGGSSGGGSQLTPLAEELMEKYEKIQKIVEKETDQQFTNELGTLLPIKN